MKKIKLEIVGTGRKLNEEDSLLVLVDPQWADYIEEVYRSLEELTGHPRHAILPIPKDHIKIFSVKHPLIVENPELLKRGAGHE